MEHPYSQADFAYLALEAFPELGEEFRSVGPHLTLQMAVFARRLQQAKGIADWDSYARGVEVIEALWQRPDHRLSGALTLTLMKGLDFEGPRGPRAWEILPSELQRAWTATHRHLEELTAPPKKARGKRS